MTEVQVSTDAQLSREEFDADCAWLREYNKQVKDVMAAAEEGSMVAAAKITELYEAKDHWVTEHLHAHPIKVAHRRGQPIRPDTVERFAEWVNEHEIGDLYTRRRVSQLMSAHKIGSEYLRGTRIYSENAIQPLRGFLKDRESELPQIARRIRELANGGPVTQGIVRQAVHDYKQSLVPAKAVDTGHRTPVDHAAIIRAEFRIILASKRFRDAGQLVNELRAMLMEAAGISDE